MASSSSQYATATKERRKAQHLRLMEQLDMCTLSDSCCEICHCDCYSSHRSYDNEDDGCSVTPRVDFREFDEFQAATHKDNNNNRHSPKQKRKTARAKKSKRSHKTPSKSAKATPTHTARLAQPDRLQPCAPPLRRSKSVCSLRTRSRTPSPLTLTTAAAATPKRRAAYNKRDCQQLQQLLNALNDQPDFEINGQSALSSRPSDMKAATSCETLPRLRAKAAAEQPGQTLKLCSSLASLCLAPTVHAAYQQVPAHDKRILNRMANKRSEQLLAKENAWLARKYWENERYERELFKCAQMEEYKRAVRDKQFQDYLQTKARLNEIASRDLAELQRLRATLQQKDACAKRRLDAIRVERGIAQCQRRCEELRRSEAVAVQQEEQHLDETQRKRETCARLSERLQRADHIRSQMLDSYLRRLRYDNQVEQLLHEEHWREAQELERYKRDQLKQQIEEKRYKTQRFAADKQRRNEAMVQKAKISASLRELVRSSVTPEGGAASEVMLGNTVPLAKVLLDRPFSKLSID